MAICHHCGAETHLHFKGIPICLACSYALDAKQKPIPNDVKLTLPHTIET
jgi:hypothetical protein